jgi:hypothetical protein
MSSVRIRRAVGVATSALLAVSALAAPVNAGDSRTVSVGSGSNGALPSGITISGGESVPFVLTVRNGGRQTLNNVLLNLGRDGLPAVPEAYPQTSVVPAQPIDLPDGVIVSASGAGATAAGCNGGGRQLSCAIGTLSARETVTIDVLITTTKTTLAAAVPLKAVVTVAEIGNDQGANKDTFAAEGGLTVIKFSCESIAAYRGGGQSKTVSTCDLGDPDNTNSQSTSVTIPSELTSVTLSEGVSPACPTGSTCYGETVGAFIEGDETTDVISWTIVVNLTENGLSKPNLQQLVVYHFNDAGVEDPLGGILLSKKNACKNAGSFNCGSASLATDTSGDLILTVTVQTAGNGGLRVQG